MTRLHVALLTGLDEGFVEFDGATFYVIPDLDRLAPFLMSLVSDSDHWCFVSSTGTLTAGRRDAATALFPYETDDRLHLGAGISGPATVFFVRDGDSQVWEPFRPRNVGGVIRAIAKSVVGDEVVFEEVHETLGLAFRYWWATSDRFGFVRRAELINVGTVAQSVTIADGIVNVLPHGLTPDLYRSMSNLTNAYRRSQFAGGPANLALHTLESLIVDQAMPAESLRATVTWSIGPGPAAVSVDQRALDAVRAGRSAVSSEMITGRPGAHVVTSDVTLEPGSVCSWYIAADVAQDHSQIAALRRYLADAEDVAEDLESSVRQGSSSLVAKLAAADALQETGDARASAHHFANVLFNSMRGGVPLSGYRCPTVDFASFVEERNRDVSRRWQVALEALPPALDRAELVDWAGACGDPDLERLALEYLPLSFSRRHGDPSRPWNRFSIRVREQDGTPIVHYEGNWRDIFQNWEAMCMSFPEYLPGVIALFVNASTTDGFNPYRITRSGIEWEVPDPGDPWGNIGYWGDHQIVYLLRLLEAADRFVPGTVAGMLDRALFTYADVPYRLSGYEDLVADPQSTITYDEDAAARARVRANRIGGDGKLLAHPDGSLYCVTLLEKLLVAALSKLSSYVPGGGVWMNTQRPEWNDANNALVGSGLSVVTLCHLRRYVSWLEALTARSDQQSIALSAEVADWLADVTAAFRALPRLARVPAEDHERGAMMGELGRAYASYRSRVYSSGFSGTVRVAIRAVRDLCAMALPHLEATIRQNRRPDGLYHAYNLIRFGDHGERSSIETLPEMLEGQVAVLSSGVLGPSECAEVIDALFASALYRSDQDSFILYPNRRPPSFLDKNRIPEHLVRSNPLFARLLEAGDSSVVRVDVDGVHHFSPNLRNATDLTQALDQLTATSEWRRLVEQHRGQVLDAYEAVFHHHAFTGRSGTMYAYEGLGSIYWHMVAKLMLASQECVIAAQRSGADPGVVDRLRSGYFRIRSGLGFNKTATEYGAFPTDPYSHTPAHAGAQQPGMTGQVKEEILTRPGELGVWFDQGELILNPILLRAREFLTEPSEWTFVGVDGESQTIELTAGSFGFTICQVPIVVSAGGSATRVDVVRSDGSVTRSDGARLDRSLSREIFGRTGAVAAVLVRVPQGDAVRP